MSLVSSPPGDEEDDICSHGCPVGAVKFHSIDWSIIGFLNLVNSEPFRSSRAAVGKAENVYPAERERKKRVRHFCFCLPALADTAFGKRGGGSEVVEGIELVFELLQDALRGGVSE